MKEQIIEFEVEVRRSLRNRWSPVALVKPQYRYETRTLTKKILWFTWTKKVKRIVNRVRANRTAADLILSYAKRYHCQDWRVRVQRHVIDSQGYSYWEIIWRDGEYLDQ